MPSIVQFFHPGSEHGYDSIYKNNILYKYWNKGEHKRKFVINNGSYIENNIKSNGKMLFWCEWEPISLVETLSVPNMKLPHEKYPEYLHYPLLPLREEITNFQEENYQNTDPFIFGDCFKYSICRQNSCPVLRDLEKGSIILFGSRVNNRFVLDTLFVVNDYLKYNSALDKKLEEFGIYTEIVIKMACSEQLQKNNNLNRTLYFGATYENSIDGMFPFVPAKKYENKKLGFSRVVMPNDFYESKNQRINKYFSSWRIENNLLYEGKNIGIKETYVTLNEIKYFWKYLKEYISEEYILGIYFNLPEVGKMINIEN